MLVTDAPEAMLIDGEPLPPSAGTQDDVPVANAGSRAIRAAAIAAGEHHTIRLDQGGATTLTLMDGSGQSSTAHVPSALSRWTELATMLDGEAVYSMLALVCLNFYRCATVYILADACVTRRSALQSNGRASTATNGSIVGHADNGDCYVVHVNGSFVGNSRR